MERGIGSTAAAVTAGEVCIVDPITGKAANVGESGSIEFQDDPSTACSITSVGDEITSTSLLAALATRKSLRVVNDSSAVLYVACTEAASATNYTARLEQYDAIEIAGFTGAVFGLWASDAAGSARISEFT